MEQIFERRCEVSRTFWMYKEIKYTVILDYRSSPADLNKELFRDLHVNEMHVTVEFVMLVTSFSFSIKFLFSLIPISTNINHNWPFLVHYYRIVISLHPYLHEFRTRVVFPSQNVTISEHYTWSLCLEFNSLWKIMSVILDIKFTTHLKFRS